MNSNHLWQKTTKARISIFYFRVCSPAQPSTNTRKRLEKQRVRGEVFLRRQRRRQPAAVCCHNGSLGYRKPGKLGQRSAERCQTRTITHNAVLRRKGGDRGCLLVWTVQIAEAMYSAGFPDESTPLLVSPSSAVHRPRIRLNRAREASAPLRFSPAFAPARVHANTAPTSTASENQYPLVNTSL